MADKRMFSKSVIDTDNFYDMPLSAQCLYFHLGMHADDDGFLANYRKIIRCIGANESDLNVLDAAGFIIKFDSGIIVIKHWKLNNYIQKDRYHGTLQVKEKSMVQLNADTSVYELCTDSIQNGHLDKISIDKNSIDKISIGESEPTQAITHSVNPFDYPSEDRDLLLEHVKDYFAEKNYNSDAEKFYNYYEAIEWKCRNGSRVKNWHRLADNWEKQEPTFRGKTVKKDAFDD